LGQMTVGMKVDQKVEGMVVMMVVKSAEPKVEL